MPFSLRPTRLDHLPSSPLRLALVQVRYRGILAIEQTDRIAAFQEKLGDSYEFLDTQFAHTVQVYFGKSAPDFPPATAETIWRFRHFSNGWVIALSTTSMSLEAVQYRDFVAFSHEFQRVLKILTDVFSPRTRTRFGMRYINEIIDARLRDRNEIAHFVRKDLVGPVGGALGSDLASSLCDYRFKQPDGLFTLRCGLVSDEAFLLDYDYYSEDEAEFDVADIDVLARNYHAAIEALFRWCITKEFLSELRTGNQNAT